VKKNHASGEIYRSILKQNVSHTPAMTNLATCYLNLGEFGEATELLNRAIEIEPNDTAIYRLIASAFGNHGFVEAALHYLDRTLARYRWDAATWTLKSSIAGQYDRVEVIDSMIEELSSSDRADSAVRFLPELRRLIREGMARRDLKHTATTDMQNANWSQALTGWNRVGPTHWDLVDRLNVAICSYRLAKFQDAAEHSLAVATFGAIAADSAMGLCLLANAQSGDWQQAIGIATFLEQKIKDPIDLPSLPQVVLARGAAVEEDRSSSAYVETLSALLERTSSSGEKRALERLIERYRARDDIVNR
jgi:tetratricopeptide (TPR) repeat protein